MVRTIYKSGTVLYAGPFPKALQPNLTDFMLLELVKGMPRLHLNLGGGETHVLQLNKNVRRFLHMCIFNGFLWTFPSSKIVTFLEKETFH